MPNDNEDARFERRLDELDIDDCRPCGWTKEQFRESIKASWRKYGEKEKLITVPASLLDKVRELMDAHDAMTKKPTLLTIADYEEIRHAVREALAEIEGGIDETDKR